MEKLASKEDIPDAFLIDQILEGQKKLYECIIRRYNQRLYRVGMSVLANEGEVEDAMQTAYIKAYEHLDRFMQKSSFGTWLTRIMLNECFALKKKRKRFTSQSQLQLENYNEMTTPSDIVMNKELAGILERAVSGLPEKYRLVFVLREIEELSVKETGATLGIEESNVRVRLNRAKAMLKADLDGYVKSNVYSFHLFRCDRMVERVLCMLK